MRGGQQGPPDGTWVRPSQGSRVLSFKQRMEARLQNAQDRAPERDSDGTDERGQVVELYPGLSGQTMLMLAGGAVLLWLLVKK